MGPPVDAVVGVVAGGEPEVEATLIPPSELGPLGGDAPEDGGIAEGGG